MFGSCAVIVTGATLASELDNNEEIGVYSIILGVVLVALAVFQFPWETLFNQLGLSELPKPGLVSLIGISVALSLASLFLGLHLGDVISRIRLKRQAKAGNKSK